MSSIHTVRTALIALSTLLLCSCASPTLKVASNEVSYGFWINYRPISMSKIPEKVGVLQSNESGCLEFSGNVEKAVIFNADFSKKLELSRMPMAFRIFGYWSILPKGPVAIEDDVTMSDIDFLNFFFETPVAIELLATDKSTYDSIKQSFLSNCKKTKF